MVNREGCILPRHFLNIPLVYKLGTRWIGCLPTSLSYAISRSISDISYLFYRTAAGSVKQNLSRAFPSYSDEAISELAARLFRNYGRYLVDYARFTRLNKSEVTGKIISFDGKENLKKALKMGKGMILLTAHLGNWELGGIFFGNYGIRTNVVTIRDENQEIDNIRRRYRERHNVATITIGNSPFSAIEMVKALNNGEVVALLIDRYDGGLDTITTDFFGTPTKFPRGPFILSRLTEAPIITAFVVREKEGYKGIISQPLVVTHERGEHEALGTVVKMLEKYIIMYPDQWYNFVPV